MTFANGFDRVAGMAAAIISVSMAVSLLLGHPAHAAGAAPGKTPKTSPYRTASAPQSAKTYYYSALGIDNLMVRQTASGSLIRFSYRVQDPARAKILGDKRATPYMFGVRSQALLQVPVMDKIGQLRQTGAPKAGKQYWMVFSNKGNFVRAGDRVNVIIGSARVDGLLVE